MTETSSRLMLLIFSLLTTLADIMCVDCGWYKCVFMWFVACIIHSWASEWWFWKIRISWCWRPRFSSLSCSFVSCDKNTETEYEESETFIVW